ncbi:hypothetical protein SMACR_07354 [Sordaria macrospora]|uniref:WGS project CABT00000000 data, contig 2.45 n=2 Tax=Sordaria macrospora TaxID=5147 RepID=F7W8K0_SORMK|nr:uncharacterized protein SMAC_07354 [Sordaria macrospora k-hell]KAA8631136.1 hypothetical protein SMACR_07354 [Sordaria macrospora]WPJ61696.1 hypothetical protein SMAC4_07354 [Sordaria macrospora]CCC05031.1 unnamed protein product [Sordaria macrospora k-hell]
MDHHPARERQYQEQLRQLTNQLGQKEDQYVAQLRELRLNNRLAPGASQSVSSSHDCTPVGEDLSSGWQVQNDKHEKMKLDTEFGRLKALLQAKERQYQQHLGQLTKQLERKEDQYLARLRELRLGNNLAPDINRVRADSAAEYQAKENANLGALSSTLYKEKLQHQLHINRTKAEKEKVQERWNNLQAELDGAIVNFSKEVAELKSRDPFEPVRKADAEIQASWKDLAIQVRQFVQTYCLPAIPFTTPKELHKKNILPGIQMICADVAEPALGDTLETTEAHVSSLPKDANWASRVAALHSWKARSFVFLKQLRPKSRDEIAALAYRIASLLEPITGPTVAVPSGSGSKFDSQQPQHNNHDHHQQQAPHQHHNHQNHYPQPGAPPLTYPSPSLLSALEALLTAAISLDNTFRLSLANYTIIFKDPAVFEFRPSMMEIKPISFASFNAATSSQRDSVSLNDASVNARAIADSLKVNFAVSPEILRAGDWKEGGDYHIEVVVAKLVVVCNAESVLRRPRPSPNPSTPVPSPMPGEIFAWLQEQNRRGSHVDDQILEKARLGFGTGVNEGPVPERSLHSSSMGPPGAGTGVLMPPGRMPPGTGIGPAHGFGGGSNAPNGRPYVRPFEYTHNHNNSGGHPNLGVTSHFHNTSRTTYNYNPSASHPSTYSNNTLAKDPSHIGQNPNNANTAESQWKRRRVLHRGTRHSLGDPLQTEFEATDDGDSDSENTDEPTAETSAVTTRGAKRQRLQLLRDGLGAITGAEAGPNGAESAREEEARAHAATTSTSAASTSTTAMAIDHTGGAIRDTTNNGIFPNLNNIVAYLKNKPRDGTGPLSLELEDDIIAALEKSQRSHSTSSLHWQR